MLLHCILSFIFWCLEEVTTANNNSNKCDPIRRITHGIPFIIVPAQHSIWSLGKEYTINNYTSYAVVSSACVTPNIYIYIYRYMLI